MQYPVEGGTGRFTVNLGNLRAQYRRYMSSTPETGRLACTSVVSRCGPLGVYTDGYGVQRECSTRLEPLGAYTVGYGCIADAVSRFRAARGVYRWVRRATRMPSGTVASRMQYPVLGPLGAYTDGYGCIANAVSRFRAARGVCRWVRCNANAVSRLEPLGAYTELITPAVRAARGGIRYTREI